MQGKKLITGDKFYSIKYSDDEWLRQRKEDAVTLIKKVSELKLFNVKTRVLDTGCGSGEFALEIKSKYDCQTYGIDLNEIGIKRAKRSGVKVQLADLDKKWPFKDNYFNVVNAMQIIEHVINPDHFLQESYRVLKKGGCLIITTPNLAAWFNRALFLFGYQPFFLEASTIDKTVGLSFTKSLTPNREPMGHIRCFTLKALKDMFYLHKFKPIMIKGNDVYYLPKYLKPFDLLFSHFPSLSTDLLIVGRKE